MGYREELLKQIDQLREEVTQIISQTNTIQNRLNYIQHNYWRSKYSSDQDPMIPITYVSYETIACGKNFFITLDKKHVATFYCYDRSVIYHIENVSFIAYTNDQFMLIRSNYVLMIPDTSEGDIQIEEHMFPMYHGIFGLSTYCEYFSVDCSISHSKIFTKNGKRWVFNNPDRQTYPLNGKYYYISLINYVENESQTSYTLPCIDKNIKDAYFDGRIAADGNAMLCIKHHCNELYITTDGINWYTQIIEDLPLEYIEAMGYNNGNLILSLNESGTFLIKINIPDNKDI